MNRHILSVLALGACLTPTSAQAQNPFITASLTPNPASTTAGGTVTFNGTITNSASDTQTVFINGDSITLPTGSPLKFDDTAFFNATSFSLAPGQSFGSASTPFFTVTVASGTAPGAYSGVFNILGGADNNAQNLQASVTFTVNAIAPAPEPSACTAFSLGALGLAGLGWKARKRRAVV